MAGVSPATTPAVVQNVERENAENDQATGNSVNGFQNYGNLHHGTSASVPNGIDTSNINGVVRDEEWECQHWAAHISKDYFSFDVNEIMSNVRMVTLTTSDIEFHPNLNVIFMETVRAAVYKHDWLLVAKSVEGMCDQASTTRLKYSLLWNGGFLAIINLFKDDIEKVEEFAMYAKDILWCYPRKLGIEFATWLTQKGYFSKGLLRLEEWHEKSGKSAIWDTRNSADNSKRKIIDLIATLYKAVFQYSCWKRDKILLKDGTYEGDEFTLKRCGERALLLFEELLEMSDVNEADSDVTIFIEPLIELTMEYRSVYHAKQIFETVVLKHYRNAYTDGMYIEFLQKYFPFLNADIEERVRLQQRYTFRNQPKGWRLQTWRVRNYRITRKSNGETIPLLPKENPKFSW